MKIPKEERDFWVSRGFKDPLYAYLQHKATAKQRGIGFLLTEMEWWNLWAPHYHERGLRKGQKVMCRTGDSGPYELGNVRIDLFVNNVREAVMLGNMDYLKDAWSGESARYEWLSDRFEMTKKGVLEEKDAEELDT